ncbi:MAG TPA: hypothetical protein VMH23_14680 [Bacteroidota bacterium]|nr:hypothetical protein [Bacteroidota bacterium]
MIDPKEFYDENEIPGRKSQDAMWRSIERSTLRPRAYAFIQDGRSFVFGMAASVILGLALFGSWTLARQVMENSQPTPLKLERAYVSAIREFERVVPAATTNIAERPSLAGQLQSRQEQLKLINSAIAALRDETGGRDLSPLKREKLRGLYSQELKILQEMIEEGEIEL